MFPAAPDVPPKAGRLQPGDVTGRIFFVIPWCICKITLEWCGAVYCFVRLHFLPLLTSKGRLQPNSIILPIQWTPKPWLFSSWHKPAFTIWKKDQLQTTLRLGFEYTTYRKSSITIKLTWVNLQNICTQQLISWLFSWMCFHCLIHSSQIWSIRIWDINKPRCI